MTTAGFIIPAATVRTMVTMVDTGAYIMGIVDSGMAATDIVAAGGIERISGRLGQQKVRGMLVGSTTGAGMNVENNPRGRNA